MVEGDSAYLLPHTTALYFASFGIGYYNTKRTFRALSQYGAFHFPKGWVHREELDRAICRIRDSGIIQRIINIPVIRTRRHFSPAPTPKN